MAEPTPGAPSSGVGGGPRSATAASFKVDDKSLRELRKTWQGLTQDVLNFNKALEGLKKGDKSLESIQQRLHSLGMGGGTGSHSGGTSGQPANGGTSNPAAAPGEGTPPLAGGATFSGGLAAAQQGSRWSQMSRGQKVGTVAGAGLGAIAGGAISYYGRSQGAISDLNLAYVQAAQGRGYSTGRVGDARSQLMGHVGGYQDANDLLTGVSTITSAIGSTAGSARSNMVTQQTGAIAAGMPGMGYAAAAQGVSQLYNPAVAQRLRSIGAAPSGTHGRLQSPSQTYQQIQRIVFRGRKVTPTMISEGLQPGAPLYVTLQGLGLDETGIEAFRSYALAQANLDGDGGRASRALLDASQGRSTADTKRAGLTTSIRSQQNRLGTADTRRQGEAERESGDAIRNSFAGLAQASDLLTASFAKLNSATGGGSGAALGYTGTLGAPVRGALGSLGGFGGAVFSTQAIGGAVRGFFGGGGARGAVMGGAGGAVGASGAMGTPVFVTNWPAGGGFGGGGGAGGGAGGGGGLLSRGGRLLGRLGGGALTRLGGLGAADGSLLGGVGAGGAGSAAYAGGVFTVAAATSAMAAKGISNLPHMYGDFGLNKKVNFLYGDYYKKGTPAQRAILDAHRGAVMAGLSKAAHTGTWDTLLGNIHDGQLKSAIKALESDLSTGKVPGATPSAPTTPTGAGATAPTPKHFSSIYDTGAPKGDGIGEIGDGPGGATNSRGPNTVNTIISMANGGPAHRVSSTVRPGAHTVSGGLSYHATGNAVDFAGPKPSKDSNSLLAINRFFAQKFGAGLKELIYSGPGAVNLYNGKPHTFSKAVRDIHHDHVHVAATEESLKKAGGVTAGTGGTTANGGTISTSGTGSAGGAPGVFADEQSALASVLNQSMFGNAAGVGAARSAQQTTTSATTGAGPVGKQVGKVPTGAPMGNARIIVEVAKQMGLTKRGAIIGIATAEQESNLRNLSGGDRDSAGLFQQRPSQGWGTFAQVTDPHYAAKAFFSRLKGTDYNHLPLTVAAQKVQRSGYPDAYAKWEKTATNIVNQIGYSKGAYELFADETARVHKGEMILRSADAKRVRSMLASQTGSRTISATTMSGSSSPGRVTVTIQAPISVVGKATAGDAREFLSMVKDEMEKDETLMSLGSER